VDVFLVIGMAMVIPVMSRPPEDSFLHARLSEKCHQELESPIQFVRSMAEITVIAGRRTERPSGIGGEEQKYIFPSKWDKKHENAGDMKKNERDQAVDLEAAPHKCSAIIPSCMIVVN